MAKLLIDTFYSSASRRHIQLRTCYQKEQFTYCRVTGILCPCGSQSWGVCPRSGIHIDKSSKKNLFFLCYCWSLFFWLHSENSYYCSRHGRIEHIHYFIPVAQIVLKLRFISIQVFSSLLSVWIEWTTSCYLSSPWSWFLLQGGCMFSKSIFWCKVGFTQSQ